MVATREGYLIPTYGPTGISPAAGAEAGMAAGRAAQTQRELTLNARQNRVVADQQMRRLDEADGVAAAERDRVKTARDKEEAEFLKFFEGTAPPPFKAGVQPGQFGAGVQPGQFGASAGLSFGPAVPAVQLEQFGVGPTAPAPEAPGGQPLPLEPAAPDGTRAAVPSSMQDTSLAIQFAPIWSQLEQQNNLPQGYLRRLAEVESSLNPAARNPNSTAEGLFQFLRGTARQYNVQNPSDPMDATQGAVRYTVDSVRVLTQALGRQPTPAELYLAHQQGAGGAVNLLRNPNQLASAVVGEAAIRLNGGDPATTTAGEFAALWINKFNGGSNSRRNVPPRPGTVPETPPAVAPGAPEVDPRVLEARDFGGGVRGAVGGVFDQAAGAASAAGSGLFGVAADVLGTGAAVLGFPKAAAGFEKASDQAYNIAYTNLLQGLSATQGMSAADFDAEPEQFRAAIAQAEADAAAAETPTAPIRVRTPGGETLSFGSAVPAVQLETMGVGGVGLSLGPTVPAADILLGAPVPATAPAPAPVAAPANAPANAPAAAGLPATRGNVAGEILSKPAGVQLPSLRGVIAAGPARMTQEMQALEQQDALLARLGEYYAATGNRAEAVATRFKRLELRVSHEALQAAQAVTFMDFNNFAPAASVLSAATGASIQIQPLDNNTFNLLANGQVFGEGLTFDQLKGYVRSVTDAEYRQQQAALNELVVAAEIERRGKDADAINTMMLEVAKLVQTGENAAALELLRQNEFAVEATDAGIVLYKKDSSEMYLVNPDGRITKANGDTVSGPTSTRIDIK